MSARGLVQLVLAVGLLAACSDSETEPRPARDAVLYTIGLSTDPYGRSTPRGVGVVTRLLSAEPSRVETRRGVGGGADWLDGGRILVPQKGPLRRPFIYRYAEGRLSRMGTAPFPAGSQFAWSPDRRLVAFEPPRPCRVNQRSLISCYRASGAIFVQGSGMKARKVAAGHLMGWTADGRIGYFRSYQRATPKAVDVRTGRTGEVLPGWRTGLPVWSKNLQYAAAVTGAGVVIVRSNGKPVQTIRSRLVISVVAWSPVGNRLAFTTSGFPDPHQLFVLDRPGAKPRLLYATGAMHFDWITWSPDGKWILLDEEHHRRWLLFRADRPTPRRSLPRLGGRPLWCCPVNSFIAFGAAQPRAHCASLCPGEATG